MHNKIFDKLSVHLLNDQNRPKNKETWKFSAENQFIEMFSQAVTTRETHINIV